MKPLKVSTHLSQADATSLFELWEYLTVNEVPLTQEQYRFVKSIEWYSQTKFWLSHLTKQGFMDFQAMPSQGSKGKYSAYLKIWNTYNSPLMKALR